MDIQILLLLQKFGSALQPLIFGSTMTLQSYFHLQLKLQTAEIQMVLLSSASPLSVHHTLYGEATAALLATQLVVNLDLSSFILEGDSLTVTLALQQPTITQDYRIASTISTILFTILVSSSWQASYVNQSANCCAHHVANWVATKIYFGCIPISSPLLASFSTLSWKSFSFHFLCSIVFFIYQCTLKKEKKKRVVLPCHMPH
jgi:hypothetical protein